MLDEGFVKFPRIQTIVVSDDHIGGFGRGRGFENSNWENRQSLARNFLGKIPTLRRLVFGCDSEARGITYTVKPQDVFAQEVAGAGYHSNCHRTTSTGENIWDREWKFALGFSSM